MANSLSNASLVISAALAGPQVAQDSAPASLGGRSEVPNVQREYAQPAQASVQLIFGESPENQTNRAQFEPCLMRYTNRSGEVATLNVPANLVEYFNEAARRGYALQQGFTKSDDVIVLDSNGNKIGTVLRYGNNDWPQELLSRMGVESKPPVSTAPALTSAPTTLPTTLAYTDLLGEQASLRVDPDKAPLFAQAHANGYRLRQGNSKSNDMIVTGPDGKEIGRVFLFNNDNWQNDLLKLMEKKPQAHTNDTAAQTDSSKIERQSFRPLTTEQRLDRARKQLEALGVKVAKSDNSDFGEIRLERNGQSIGKIVDYKSLDELAQDLESAARIVTARHQDLRTISPAIEEHEWYRRQQQVARLSLTNDPQGRLLNSSRFMSRDCASALQAYNAQESASQDRIVKIEPDKNQGFSYALERNNGERYFISESPWFRDQYPAGKPFENTELVLRSATDPNCIIAFKSTEVFSGGRVNFERLTGLLQEAQANRQSEIMNGESLARFDLTRLPIGYVGLVDPNVKQDPVIHGLALDVSSYPGMMNSLTDQNGNPRYNFVTRNDRPAIAVEREPAAIMKEELKELYERGVRSFYISLAGHGSEEGVHFISSRGHLVLRPDELTEMFNNYRDCSFVIDTLACKGGGIASEIQNYRDPTGHHGRITVKLQSKLSSNNQEGRVIDSDNRPQAFSSYYNIFFSELISTHPFGRAHLLADLEAKRRVGCDAEIWQSGPAGGSSVKGVIGSEP